MDRGCYRGGMFKKDLIILHQLTSSHNCHDQHEDRLIKIFKELRFFPLC